GMRIADHQRSIPCQEGENDDPSLDARNGLALHARRAERLQHHVRTRRRHPGRRQQARERSGQEQALTLSVCGRRCRRPPLFRPTSLRRHAAPFFFCQRPRQQKICPVRMASRLAARGAARTRARSPRHSGNHAASRFPQCRQWRDVTNVTAGTVLATRVFTTKHNPFWSEPMQSGISLQTTRQTNMSPAMQRALSMLQLSTLEFAQQVRESLASNPMLESDDDVDAPGEADVAVTAANGESAELGAVAESSELGGADADSSYMSEPWLDSGSRQGGTDPDFDPIALAPDTPRLRDMLLQQAGCLNLSERDALLVRAII